jgi:hypothetical protein
MSGGGRRRVRKTFRSLTLVKKTVCSGSRFRFLNDRLLTCIFKNGHTTGPTGALSDVEILASRTSDILQNISNSIIMSPTPRSFPGTCSQINPGARVKEISCIVKTEIVHVPNTILVYVTLLKNSFWRIRIRRGESIVCEIHGSHMLNLTKLNLVHKMIIHHELAKKEELGAQPIPL